MFGFGRDCRLEGEAINADSLCLTKKEMSVLSRNSYIQKQTYGQRRRACRTSDTMFRNCRRMEAKSG